MTKAYVDKLLHGLKRTGMDRTLLGPTGGYLLNLDARTIKLSDIYEKLEGPIYLVPFQGVAR
jgi:DNA-binding IscR family transcriptional regulator